MMAAKRCSGQGWRMRAAGSQASAIGFIRFPVEPGTLTSSAKTTTVRTECEKHPAPPSCPEWRNIEVSSNDRLKPCTLFCDGLMHTLPEFRFDLVKLGGQPLLYGGA